MKYPTFQGVMSMYSFKSHITKSAFFQHLFFWNEGNFRRNLKIFWCAPPCFFNFNDFQSDFGDQFLNLSKFIILKRVYLSFFVEIIE